MRNKLIRVRRFIKTVNPSLSAEIQPPKVPELRERVIKVRDVKKLLERIGVI